MIEREEMHPGFIKSHLNRNGEEGWPSRPVIHNFTTPDTGDPHDHPWDFRSYISDGWYVEEIYAPDGSFEIVRRNEGDVVNVNAEHVHRILEVAPEGCMTYVKYGSARREPRFWRFEDGKALSRQWNEKDFK